MRMADALFDHIDRSARGPGVINGTGYIEPEKYDWLLQENAVSEQEVRLRLAYARPSVH